MICFQSKEQSCNPETNNALIPRIYCKNGILETTSWRWGCEFWVLMTATLAMGHKFVFTGILIPGYEANAIKSRDGTYICEHS
ncbi:hypothetical protein C5167_043473 [Papaver somniferum]|uniref:Uncharacterized protein n=1 Tax=Papaver somniferum TaxID=3469 RepID=A0A4Y7L5U4_PAPSO|nr:hypothetical protein C5167_043473 [Papaver somniferum]